jgi:hypothetical protein
MLKRVLAIVAFLFSNTLLAQGTNKSDLLVYGVATRTCAEFLKVQDLNNEVYGFYVAWVQGYLSALNFHRVHGVPDLGRSRDLASLLSWLKAYCSQRPSDNFMLAVSKLESELK